MQADDDALLVAPPVPNEFRLLRYDARGHGQSGGGTVVDHSWAALALDLLGFADVLGLPTFVAAGASMGAATVLHAATFAPQRVQAMVLVIPPTAWELRRSQREVYLAAADLIGREGIEPYVRGVIAAPPPVVNEDLPRWSQQRRALLEAADPARLVVSLRGAAESDLPAPSRLAAIEVPALILAWRGDPVHPLESATRLAEMLPSATLVIADSLADVRSWPKKMSRWIRGVMASGA
jgi:pimeloyl-ACP methyl ester carboxylesterase